MQIRKIPECLCITVFLYRYLLVCWISGVDGWRYLDVEILTRIAFHIGVTALSAHGALALESTIPDTRKPSLKNSSPPPVYWAR
jgi:hypothetical protein